MGGLLVQACYEEPTIRTTLFLVNSSRLNSEVAQLVQGRQVHNVTGADLQRRDATQAMRSRRGLDNVSKTSASSKPSDTRLSRKHRGCLEVAGQAHLTRCDKRKLQYN